MGAPVHATAWARSPGRPSRSSRSPTGAPPGRTRRCTCASRGRAHGIPGRELERCAAEHARQLRRLQERLAAACGRTGRRDRRRHARRPAAERRGGAGLRAGRHDRAVGRRPGAPVILTARPGRTSGCPAGEGGRSGPSPGRRSAHARPFRDRGLPRRPRPDPRAPRRPREGARRVRLAPLRRAVQLGGRLVRQLSPATTAATALHIVEEDGREARYSFADLVRRSDQVAGWLRAQGVAAGDRVVLMLGNQVELWESMLAVMKLGAVIMPTTTALGPADLIDRIERGGARHVVVNAADAAKFDAVPGDYTRIAVGDAPDGLARLRATPRRPTTPRRASGHAARRPAAALLHQRDDEPAEAGRAHPGQLSRRAPVDRVLARPAARRRAPEHQLAGLGQARVELLLRPLDRRGDGLPLQLRALRPGRRCSTGSAATASPPSARPRRSGGC